MRFDVVDNPLPYLTRAVMGTTFHLNLRRTDVGVERGIHGLTYQLALAGEAEVFEQHGGRENLRQWVGKVLSGSLRPREGCVLG